MRKRELSNNAWLEAYLQGGEGRSDPGPPPGALGGTGPEKKGRYGDPVPAWRNLPACGRQLERARALNSRTQSYC
jgi:hypothetical protein